MAREIEGEFYRASMLTFRLAKGYLKAGKIDKASTSFSDFITFWNPRFPKNDRRIVNIYLEIAKGYEDGAQWKESLVYYKRAYKALIASTGALHREVIPVLNGMAQVTGQLGDTNKAEKIFRKALSIIVKVNGTSIHPSALPVLKNLESIYQKQSMNDRLLLIQSRIKKIGELN